MKVCGRVIYRECMFLLGLSEQTDRLRIENLRVRAQKILQAAPSELKLMVLAQLLFNEFEWDSALSGFVDKRPNPSLALTNCLGGCIALIENEEDGDNSEQSYTSAEFSSVLRMANFAMELASSVDMSLETLPEDNILTLLYHFVLIDELGKDNLSILGTNMLWKQNEGHTEGDILKLFEKMRSWVNSQITSDTARSTSLSELLYDRLEADTEVTDSSGFVAARALGSLMSSLGEQNGYFRERGLKWVEETDIWKSDSWCPPQPDLEYVLTPADVYLSTAMLTGFRPLLNTIRKQRICNELISTLSGIPPQDAGSDGLRKLVLLNTALPGPDEDPTPIPQSRVIRLIKHLLWWFDEEVEETEITPGLISEVMKVLAKLLPQVQELYGEHWMTTLELLRDIWMVCHADHDWEVI